MGVRIVTIILEIELLYLEMSKRRRIRASFYIGGRIKIIRGSFRDDLGQSDSEFARGKLDNETLKVRIYDIEQKYRNLIENRGVKLTSKDPWN